MTPIEQAVSHRPGTVAAGEHGRSAGAGHPAMTPLATGLFTITFPVEAPDADTAWEVLRRLMCHLPAAELEERAHVEEVIGFVNPNGSSVGDWVRR